MQFVMRAIRHASKPTWPAHSMGYHIGGRSGLGRCDFPAPPRSGLMWIAQFAGHQETREREDGTRGPTENVTCGRTAMRWSGGAESLTAHRPFGVHQKASERLRKLSTALSSTGTLLLPHGRVRLVA